MSAEQRAGRVIYFAYVCNATFTEQRCSTNDGTPVGMFFTRKEMFHLMQMYH